MVTLFGVVCACGWIDRVPLRVALGFDAPAIKYALKRHPPLASTNAMVVCSRMIFHSKDLAAACRISTPTLPTPRIFGDPRATIAAATARRKARKRSRLSSQKFLRDYKHVPRACFSYKRVERTRRESGSYLVTTSRC